MKIPSDMVQGTIHDTKFGKLVITKYIKDKHVEIRFLETGFEKISRSDHIRNGLVKDLLVPSVCGVGFLGDGIHAPKNCELSKTAYTCWGKIIERCYSPKTEVYIRNYSDCELCEEWQDFQNFCQWFIENHPNDGNSYHLDKDIKVDGNRIYSPETCLFVSPKENVTKASSKYYSITSPNGIVYEGVNLKQFCIDNDLSYRMILRVKRGVRNHHKGWRFNNK